MSCIVCEFCGDLRCVTCDDAADHPDGVAHCSDPECVAECTSCGVRYAEDLADAVAADIALTGPARCP